MPNCTEWIRLHLIKEYKKDPINFKSKVKKLYNQFLKETKSTWSLRTYTRSILRQSQALGYSTVPSPRAYNNDAKQEIKHLKKIINQMDKKETVENKLVNLIKTITIKYEPKPYIITSKRVTTNTREAVVVCSDWHLDEKVNINEMFGLNEFDWDIAEKRIDYLFQSAINNALELNCSEMTILLLGDLISGVIHEDLIYASELGLTPSVLRTFDNIAKYIVLAAQHFKIKVACVSGNHSRINPKRYYNKAFTFNLEWLLYEFLKHELLKITEVFYNGVSPLACITIQDYYFLIMHGNIVNAGNNLTNIPAITMSRDAAKINGAIRTKYQQDINQHKTPTVPPRIDYIITGHFHSEFTLPGFDAVPILGNGSLIGGNSFSLSTVKASNRPMQRFFVVEKNKGVRFQDSIYLDNID